MSTVSKNVCIIGAGCSGLASIKSCLEEGLNPTCLEIAADIGGLWHQSERLRLNQKPTMYDSLICNISKVNQGFSDFPYPKDWPPYVPWKKVMEYFNMYADHFDLRRFIKFNTKVLQVYKSKTYLDTGNWMVESLNLLNDELDVTEYEAVIAATGKISKAVYPDIPGLTENFTGKYMHGSDYVNNSDLEDKSILVIGASNSGGDISSATSAVAKKVLLSARKGVWILPRVFSDGLPLELCIVNRFKNFLLSWLPQCVMNKAARGLVNKLKSTFDYSATGLEPPYLPSHPLSSSSINDEVRFKIYTGKVQTRPAVKCISTAGKVQFVNGQEDDVDFIIAATGYEPNFPYLPQEVFSNLEDSKLYRWIFPYDLRHPHTLTIVGLFPEKGGSGFTQIEIQARYVTGVLSGRLKLPQKNVMKNRCKQTHEAMSLDGKLVFKLGMFRYQEQLASEIGLVPSFFKLLFSDPRLARMLYFGPIIPMHYRLIGEHKWENAREYSLNVWKECLSGMRLETTSRLH